MKAEIKIEISEVTPYDQVENVRMGICREIGGIRKIEYAELSRLKAEFARSFYQTIFDQFDKLVDFEEVAPNKFCGVMTIVLPKNKEKKMNLGSHNTFSYLPVRRWYMWPVVWTARCQKVNFGEQWLEGVRLFDLRLRFDKDGEPIICHGLIEFKSEKTFLDNIFKYLDYGWFRVVLETKKHDLEQERKFMMI